MRCDECDALYLRAESFGTDDACPFCGADPDTDERTDQVYVCPPCKFMGTDRAAGELVVPNGTGGRVWCPWCGDAMEEYDDAVHGPLRVVEQPDGGNNDGN